MSSSKSLPKHENKSSFSPVSPFQLFYQLTYMSAMAASGISRAKTFEIAAMSANPAAEYFEAINTLVDEFHYDYPEACRRIGVKAKTENMKSFLLRLSDALRSGEPLSDFLTREAEVQGQDYHNRYERDLEGLKQWTNAFSSIMISVSLIIIIQIVTAMIYSLDQKMMGMMVAGGMMMGGFAAYIIRTSAPREVMTVAASKGSKEQRRALQLFKLLAPVGIGVAASLTVIGLPIGWAMIILAIIIAPVGVASFQSDRITTKKDAEFSTFLRSVGSMATSTGTTLKQALTRIDLTSFPVLAPDIERLSTRLLAMVDPDVCWRNFGMETGSRLISEVVDIFYGGVKIGGDPERVGYICSLFAAKTSQLRAKRQLISGTFSGLTTVMQGVIAGLMVFVLSIVKNFADLVVTLMPKTANAMQGQSFNLTLAAFTPQDLQFLTVVTIAMILVLGLVSAIAIGICTGGLKLKIALFTAIMIMISGISLLVVPPMVKSILKV